MPLVLLHGWSDSADTLPPLLARLPVGGPAAWRSIRPGSVCGTDSIAKTGSSPARPLRRRRDQGPGGASRARSSWSATLAAARDARRRGPELRSRASSRSLPPGSTSAWFPMIEERAPGPADPARPGPAARGHRPRGHGRANARSPSPGPAGRSGRGQLVHPPPAQPPRRDPSLGHGPAAAARSATRSGPERWCPCCWSGATSDRMVFTTGAERVLRKVGQERLEVIEVCGHRPQIQAPERMQGVTGEVPRGDLGGQGKEPSEGPDLRHSRRHSPSVPSGSESGCSLSGRARGCSPISLLPLRLGLGMRSSDSIPK